LKESQVRKEATFTPKINPVSEVISLSTGNSRVKVEERLLERGKIIQKKKELCKLLEQDQLRQTHTFVPKVDRV
jgi:hypothetical protein